MQREEMKFVTCHFINHHFREFLCFEVKRGARGGDAVIGCLDFLAALPLLSLHSCRGGKVCVAPPWLAPPAAVEN